MERGAAVTRPGHHHPTVVAAQTRQERGSQSRTELQARSFRAEKLTDFTAGLVALGRDWYERAVVCPDALAEHSAVRRAAADGDESVVFDEDFHFVAPTAYERLTGDASAFWADWAAFVCARAAVDAEAGDGMGEPFDFADDEEMRRRLPRLVALRLGAGPV
ncbi:DUF4240 domain-containing protein (plasmid) [Streptomyces zhihengii]|uniref:DUF4240 domain-containing protein n=1 Tax=Streptomyces zhihengii TaxID=1818004 RepID=A0ABS2V4R8_9ACTN|nr:DUF4240 domain-containing protein [Streptomyces zhihengii]MBM9624844.1 DUF4240 domain-containing protein [Streptomyces zhihengii]